MKVKKRDSKVIEELGEQFAHLKLYYIDLGSSDRHRLKLKLSARDVRDIRRMLKHGVVMNRIAKLFGVSRQAIAQLRSGDMYYGKGRYGHRSPGYVIDPATGCWLWFGKMHPSWALSGPRHYSKSVRRFLWRQKFGPDGALDAPWGISVICDNARCVNPEHFIDRALTKTADDRAPVILSIWNSYNTPLERKRDGVTLDSIARRFGMPAHQVRNIVGPSHGPKRKRLGRRGGRTAEV